jgi:hypothetical protein
VILTGELCTTGDIDRETVYYGWHLQGNCALLVILTGKLCSTGGIDRGTV